MRNWIYAPEITKQKNGSSVIVKDFSYAQIDLSRIKMGYTNEEEFAMISFIIDLILQVLWKHEHN